MKFSLAFCWAALAITVTSQIGALPTRKIQGGEDMLMDNGGIEQANGSSVNITVTGLWDVVLEGAGLGIKFCSKKCDGEVLVCYDGDTTSENAADLCDSKCGFYITVRDNTTSVTSSSSSSEYNGKRKKDECETIVMKNGQFFLGYDPVTSCVPKIENGMVKLNVTMVSSDCPLLIKNAHLLPEPTTATSTTMSPTRGHIFSTTAKGGVTGADNGTTTEESSFIDSYWWVILIIVIVIIIAGASIGVLIYYLKCKKGKKQQAGPLGATQELTGQQSHIVEPPPPAPKGSRPPLPPSVMNPPSILSQKSLMDINREE